MFCPHMRSQLHIDILRELASYIIGTSQNPDDQRPQALNQQLNNQTRPICWAVIWGGVQNVWGEENVPDNALWSALSWIFVQENRALTPKGGGKRTVRGGGPKPVFGRGVIREVFHPPLFSTPPWRPLNMGNESCQKYRPPARVIDIPFYGAPLFQRALPRVQATFNG